MFDLKIIYLTIVFVFKRFMGNKDNKIIVKKFNGKLMYPKWPKFSDSEAQQLRRTIIR